MAQINVRIALLIAIAVTKVAIIAQSITMVLTILFLSNMDFSCFSGPDKKKDLPSTVKTKKCYPPRLSIVPNV